MQLSNWYGSTRYHFKAEATLHRRLSIQVPQIEAVIFMLCQMRPYCCKWHSPMLCG